MSGWKRAVVVLLVLAFPMPASAWFRGRGTTSSSYYYYPYYYPPSVVYVPGFVPAAPVAVAPGPCLPAGVALPPARLYAVPTPAPATPTIPAAPPAAPGVIESRSHYPAAPPPPRVTESSSRYGGYSTGVRETDSSRCSVAFWNLTSRNLTLTVAGQLRIIAPGSSVTLDLPRRFVWRIDARDEQVENVPAQQSGVDIVVRR